MPPKQPAWPGDEKVGRQERVPFPGSLECTLPMLTIASISASIYHSRCSMAKGGGAGNYEAEECTYPDMAVVEAESVT